MPTVQTATRTNRATARRAGCDGVRVIPISQLREARGSLEGRIVIDALDVDCLALPDLARAVHWHRRLVRKGRLVLAVSSEAARSLAQSGLHTVLPHRFSMQSAVDAAAADIRRPSVADG